MVRSTAIQNAVRALGAVVSFSAAAFLLTVSCLAQTPSHKKAKPPALPNPAPVEKPLVAPAAPGDILLYNGQSPADSGVTASPWGGGAVADSTDLSFANSHALKVTTYDSYQGTRLTFKNPVDLAAFSSENDRIIQITIRLASAPINYNPNQMPGGGNPTRGGSPFGGGGFGNGKGGSGMLPGSESHVASGQTSFFQSGVYTGGASVSLTQGRRGGPPGGFPGGRGGFPGGRGGFPGAGGFPGGGRGFSNPDDTSQLPPVHALHISFALTNGAQADTLRTLPSGNDSDSGNGGWVSVGVPLTALKFPGGVNSPLQSITIGGDDYGVFYIGQIRLTKDDTPLACFAGDQQSVAAGDVVSLHATGSGGASTLQYAWNFGNGDPNGIDATGQDVTTQYYKGGKDYTVTLTVSDVDGLKAPVKSTTTIHVEE